MLAFLQGCRSRPFLKFSAPAPNKVRLRLLPLPLPLVLVLVILTLKLTVYLGFRKNKIFTVEQEWEPDLKMAPAPAKKGGNPAFCYFCLNSY